MTVTGPPITILHPDAEEFIKQQQRLGAANAVGLACGKILEQIPVRPQAECEIVYEGENNTCIVLGRDRPGSLMSGAGGAKHTQCGMIDLVAGRMSSVIMRELKKNPKDRTLSESKMEPNFFADAARIYISQRTLKIDDYLGFDYTGQDTTGLSAAVMKADCTRIVGRENVRIYAGGANATNFPWDGEPRANNTDIKNPKIELIVGNKGEKHLQPAVLGKNLVNYLTENNKINNTLISILRNLIKQIMQNSVTLSALSLGGHSGVALQQAVDNIENISKMIKKQLNEAINDATYLDTLVVKGSSSVLSSNVFIT